MELAARPRVTPGASVAPQFALDAAEPGRSGTLKGEDRLFLVADGKDASCRLTSAFAGKEIRGERPDDLPLSWAGVLGLVHQDVVDAPVELILHPASRLGA